MKRPDPRVARAEKLLSEALRLIAEIKAGVPAPRKRRKRRRRYTLPGILAALREGVPFDPTDGSRDPRLPCRVSLARYRKANPAFDREAGEIMRERSRKASGRPRHGPTRGATIWAKRLPGRQYNWDAIAAKIEAGAIIGPNSTNRQGLPSHTLIMARRKADPVFAARVAAVLKLRFGVRPRATFDRAAVLELIRRGAVIAARPPEPGMPWREQLKRERKGDPQFNTEVLAAIKEARQRRCNRETLARLDRNAAWRAAEGAVPRSLEPDLRMDIVGELSLRIVSGEVSISGDLQQAWRACRTQLTRHRWKETSLDAPIPGTDGLRGIDLLEDESARS